MAVSAAPSDKAVVIDAPMGVVRQMAGLILSLDTPEGVQAVQLRVYSIETGSARELAPITGKPEAIARTRLILCDSAVLIIENKSLAL